MLTYGLTKKAANCYPKINQVAKIYILSYKSEARNDFKVFYELFFFLSYKRINLKLFKITQCRKHPIGKEKPF